MKTFSQEQKEKIKGSHAVRFIENETTIPILAQQPDTIERFLNDFIWQEVRCYTKDQLTAALTPNKGD